VLACCQLRQQLMVLAQTRNHPPWSAASARPSLMTLQMVSSQSSLHVVRVLRYTTAAGCTLQQHAFGDSDGCLLNSLCWLTFLLACRRVSRSRCRVCNGGPVRGLRKTARWWLSTVVGLGASRCIHAILPYLHCDCSCWGLLLSFSSSTRYSCAAREVYYNNDASHELGRCFQPA
jgi:hypothetical protein